jgi:phage terminase large subunit GpA-like protein
MNRLELAWAEAIATIKVKPPLTGSQWADEHFYLSPESSSVLGRWKTLPFQVGPLNWMCDDDIEEYNEQKSRRTGFTKRLLAATGYYIEHKRRNVVIWQPTDGDRDRFSKVEVDTMLRDVPALGNLLMATVGSKSKYNTTDQKTFVGTTLDLKGGKSAKNYRAMTKDVAMYDELAAFDSDVDKEGSPTTLGDGRLDDSPFPKSIRGSTAKLKGVCLIEAAVDACKFIFWRYVPCPQCGFMHRLEFANLDFESEQFICPQNGCTIDYSQYPSMDKGGQWRTLDGYYYREDTDFFYNPEDEIIDKPKKVGVKGLWAAYSYFRPWSHIIELWKSASKKSKTGDTTELKSVVNTILGETWEERGESVAPTGFMNRLEDYSFDSLPTGVLLITFGADVQGGANPRIELEICGHGLEGETWSIDYVVIHGDPEQREVWLNLDEQILRRFMRVDGVELGVAGGFIDSGYLADEVYKYTGPRRKRNIYATKGVNTGLICNKGTWQGDNKAARAILHTVNVDDAKEITFNRLKKIDTPGPGYCHFPDHYKQEYFDGLTNEQKKQKRKSGRVVGFEWVKIAYHKPNEQLDCRSYNQGILARINPNMPRIKMILEAEAERIRLNIPSEPRVTGRKVRGKRG